MVSFDNQRYIFASIFHLATRLQVVGDQYFAPDDMTSRQWYLTLVISHFGEDSPTLNEVAEQMGSSRQNVKQLVTKLEEKGFLTIDKDPVDARAIRLKLTEKCHSFWENRADKDGRFIAELFEDFTEAELSAMVVGFTKLLDRLGTMKG